jgi:hypothetical protein
MGKSTMTMPWEDYQSPQVPAGPWLDYQAAPERPASQDWHGLLPNDPNKEYGDILPFAKDKTTGKLELAIPNMIRSPIHGVGDLYQSAENQSTDMTPDAVNTALAIAPLAQLRFGMGADNAGTVAGAVKDMPGKLGRMLTDESSAPDTYSKPNFTSGDYQKAIGNTVSEAQASRKPFYDYMNEAGRGYEIDATPIIAHAKELINENASNPFQQDAVTRLQKFVDQYGETGKLPVVDAVEFKQDINALFKPNAYDQGKNSAYFQLGNKLGAAIDAVAKENPTFGKARALADKNHTENVAMAFKNNDLLKKTWQPEDASAIRSMEAGRADYLPDETMLRQRQMVNSIKTPEQLDAVTRLMPPDVAQAFRQDVLKNMKSGGWTYRAEQMGNILGDPLKAPKHIFNAVKGQPFNADEKVLMGAASRPSPQLTTQKLAEALMQLKAATPGREIVPYSGTDPLLEALIKANGGVQK